MTVLGIRCTNKDITFVVMIGTKIIPEIVVCNTIKFPQGFSKPQGLKWMLQEIDALIKKHDIKIIVMKGFEGISKGKSYEDRVEHETMFYLAAINNEIKRISKKVKSTIAKDLGLKGRARYLSKSLDTSKIVNYEKYSEKEKDAILSGWSELS